MNLPLSYVWVPARVPSKQLVVVLHGQGGSAEGWSLPDDLGIAGFNYLFLNAPDPVTWRFRRPEVISVCCSLEPLRSVGIVLGTTTAQQIHVVGIEHGGGVSGTYTGR